MSERSSSGWDQHLGLALVILAGLIIMVKLLSWSALQFVLRLWPVALVVIGYQMYRRAVDEERGRGPDVDE